MKHAGDTSFCHPPHEAPDPTWGMTVKDRALVNALGALEAIIDTLPFDKRPVVESAIAELEAACADLDLPTEYP